MSERDCGKDRRAPELEGTPAIHHGVGTRSAPKLRDGDRVTVTATDDRHYGEHGIVDGWYYGMAGGVVYQVRLDHRADDLSPYHESELDLGEAIYA